MTPGATDSVWLVSSGSYSDYSVHAAFTTKELAEETASVFNAATDSWHDYFVEERPLLSRPGEMVTTWRASVNIWDDGTTSDMREVSARVEPEVNLLYPEDAVPARWRWVRAPVHQGKGGRLEVSGVDLERVRRVFGDKRAEILATPALARRKEARS